MANYIIPIFIVFTLLYSLLKKVNAYECFVSGARQSVDLCINTFPYLVAIFAIVELLTISGISSLLSQFIFFIWTRQLHFSVCMCDYELLRNNFLRDCGLLFHNQNKKTEIYHSSLFTQCFFRINNCLFNVQTSYFLTSINCF